jgi:hypothetical protein
MAAPLVKAHPGLYVEFGSSAYDPLIVGASAAIAVIGPLVGIYAMQCARDSGDRIQWGWLLLAVVAYIKREIAQADQRVDFSRDSSGS